MFDILLFNLLCFSVVTFFFTLSSAIYDIFLYIRDFDHELTITYRKGSRR